MNEYLVVFVVAPPASLREYTSTKILSYERMGAKEIKEAQVEIAALYSDNSGEKVNVMIINIQKLPI
jgi:hypothetical protein